MGPPIHTVLAGACASLICTLAMAQPLGLPPVPIPSDNPQTPGKIALGDKLFNDKRFSSTGEVSCATCHDPKKAFTDSPLITSEGINKLTGTRNAPTVINSAYFSLFFWDGRSPNMEDQAQHPIVNPVEMGLADHDPVLKIVRTDPEYVAAFAKVFDKRGEQVTMKEVQQAIASFERTIVSGDSPFDQWYYGKRADAISTQAQRGFDVFLNKGRCVSCHTIEQNYALFTDNRFHNIGVGINRIQSDVGTLVPAFLQAKTSIEAVDKAVLTNPKASELGRFAVTDSLDELGAFKTSTLRNVAVTAPFMHDGSLATLRDVVEHYNNGGITRKTDHVNDFLSGGIRPLDLTDDEISDLVAFLETLTSPQFAAQKAASLNPASCNVSTTRMAATATPARTGGTAP
ncbi:MAG TPA: cytochrome c peroxidase [Povalibacter sp.]|uniref:cytochrome-c peroxidase n=1 Tax=Povalibacter sp. TaxID=1962978 RepID=UPI002CD90B1B|nr:cytochrome c peroxidase [Povalibacter sp.]HMN44200.1 cytochrome c peroxidase [Povalibacter sp.]